MEKSESELHFVESTLAAFSYDDEEERLSTDEALASDQALEIASLIQALGDRSDEVRWMAAKALGQIDDPRAAEALVSAMDDEDEGFAWLAARELIRLGDTAVRPLLRGLLQWSGSPRFRQGAHHVLRILATRSRLREFLLPVLAALDDIVPALEAPLAAARALQKLDGVVWLDSNSDIATRC